MDVTTLVEIVIAIVVLYFLIRFVVSPIVKAVVGVVIFIVLIYLLQRFFGFNLDQVLAPFGISFNSSKWSGLNLNWILGPANYYVDQIKNFMSYIWGNFPKASKP